VVGGALLGSSKSVMAGAPAGVNSFNINTGAAIPPQPLIEGPSPRRRPFSAHASLQTSSSFRYTTGQNNTGQNTADANGRRGSIQGLKQGGGKGEGFGGKGEGLGALMGKRTVTELSSCVTALCGITHERTLDGVLKQIEAVATVCMYVCMCVCMYVCMYVCM
jgi:hypothetical protein